MKGFVRFARTTRRVPPHDPEHGRRVRAVSLSNRSNGQVERQKAPRGVTSRSKPTISVEDHTPRGRVTAYYPTGMIPQDHE